MEISVEAADRPDLIFEFTDRITVLVLKRAISKKVGIPVRNQCLLLNENELRNTDSLSTINILSVRLKEQRPSGTPWSPIPFPTRQFFPGVHKTKEESELLGVSVAFLENEFLQEIEDAFGTGANPDYYEVNERMLHGPRGKGFGQPCPRDGERHCSFVDALDSCHTGAATVMLSWCWKYQVRTVVGTLSRWCRLTARNPALVFVWQCALCCNQYRVEAKKANHEWEPFEIFKEAFSRRVCTIRHVLAIFSPWWKSLYIERLWCIFEFHIALHVKGCCLEILLPEKDEMSFRTAIETGGMMEVWKSFESIRIQNAHTASADDRDNIFRLIDPNMADHDSSPKCAKLNAEVVKRLQEWFVETAVAGVQPSLIAGQEVSLAACYHVVDLLMWMSDWSRAMLIIERSLDSAKSFSMINTIGYAQMLQSKGKCFSFQGGHDEQAMASLREAERVYLGLGANRDLQYIDTLRVMGLCLKDQGLYDDAAVLLRKTDDTMATFDAAASFTRGAVLSSLGQCCVMQGNCQQAMISLKQARDIFEAVGARWTPSYAVVQRNIGECFENGGNGEQAMTAYTSAKDTYEKAGASASEGYAVVLSSIGFCLACSGNHGQAALLYADAERVFEHAGCLKTPHHFQLRDRMRQLRLASQIATSVPNGSDVR